MFLIFFCNTNPAFVQSPGIPINLPAPLNDPLYEYSGLGMYKGKLLLLQQYPKFTFPGLDTVDIGKQLRGEISDLNIHYWKIEHLDAIKKRLVYYQGFEAVTVVGNAIFLSVETLDPDPNCYVVRGAINDSLIALDTILIMPLKKPRKVVGDSTITLHNMGFESMVWLAKQKKLLIVFEYNRYPKKSMGYLVDSQFTGSTIIDIEPIDFRITDLTQAGNRILGINYYYKGEYDMFEPKIKIKKNGGYADWTKDDYSRIVELYIKRKKVRFKVIREISFANDNWEGIMNFQQGVLMITDRHPGSKFEYYPLD